MELVGRLGDRHDEAEVEEQLEWRRRPVVLSDVPRGHRQQPEAALHDQMISAPWNAPAQARSGRGGSTAGRPCSPRTPASQSERDEIPSSLSSEGISSMRNPGDDLLSQGASPQVPSARAGLTAVFGMGTGVSPPPWSPETVRSAAHLPFSG